MQAYLRALIEREVMAITRLFCLRALIEREGMAITRLFKRGNSQAVCIPAELAFSRWDIDPVTRSVIA